MALRMRQVLARTWVGLLDFFFLFFFFVKLRLEIMLNGVLDKKEAVLVYKTLVFQSFKNRIFPKGVNP